MVYLQSNDAITLLFFIFFNCFTVISTEAWSSFQQNIFLEFNESPINYASYCDTERN